MRSVAIVLQALNTGLAAGHVAQIRPRRKLTAAQWAQAHTTYEDYGRLAAVLAPSATLAATLTAWRDRQAGKRPAASAAAAAAIASTAAIWRFGNEPVNRQIASWNREGPPHDWQHHRDRWELSHLASAVVHLGALIALTTDSNQTPAGHDSARRPRSR